jgi:hypothetical protein
MGTTAKLMRANRTITIDFRDDATSVPLLGDGKAFVEWVLAFILSLGLQLKHQATCGGRGCLTRHAHSVRVRLGGGALWRLQCTTCRAVCTVLPHCVLRSRQMRPAVARDARLATQGGLRLELGAVLSHLSPRALERLVCARGQQSLGGMLTRCGLPLPVYCLADENQSRGLTDTVSLPALVTGRVLWHVGYTPEASAAALPESSRACQPAACQQEPSDRGKGGLTAGVDSTTKSMRTLLPGARLGTCLRHARNTLPQQLAAVTAPVRKA